MNLFQKDIMYKRPTSTDSSFTVLSYIQIDKSLFQYTPVNMITSDSVTLRFSHSAGIFPNRQEVRRLN